jgi:putative DNA primase/helicase
MLNVSWHGDKTPKPERWMRMLEQNIQTPEVIMQAQEFAGYCLTRETKFGKALLLLGPGADGKTLFLNVLKALVGTENCCSVSMSELDEIFNRSSLFGKLLNVSTEMTTKAIQSDMFKAVVTGDAIQVAFKHKNPFMLIPYCKFAYASNKIPRVLDNSDGYFRRILPILFKHQYLEGDPDLDPDLEKKLMQELDGIFAWAVIGLHRLLKQNAFTMCDETLDFMMKYRRYNSPVMAFLQDCCSLANNEAETKLKDLYKEYRAFCSEGGYSPLNKDNFFEELQGAARKMRQDTALRRHRPRRGKERPDLVVGISLTYNNELVL